MKYLKVITFLGLTLISLYFISELLSLLFRGFFRHFQAPKNFAFLYCCCAFRSAARFKFLILWASESEFEFRNDLVCI